MNIYPEEITCREDRLRSWRPGDWIIHFPVKETPYLSPGFLEDRVDGRAPGPCYKTAKTPSAKCYGNSTPEYHTRKYFRSRMGNWFVDI